MEQACLVEMVRRAMALRIEIMGRQLQEQDPAIKKYLAVAIKQQNHTIDALDIARRLEDQCESIDG
jgi:hypothetical protein